MQLLLAWSRLLLLVKGVDMKYGLAELIEEKDIPELYRKMIKEGAAWGCDWLNGFLESLNAERKPEDQYKVLVRHPGECDFCDFVFAIKNRICAVAFDVYSWDRHHLTYERRTRLIEASLEHRLMPIVVNLEGGWCMEPYKKPKEFKCGFEMAKRWMTDAVSGISVIPEIGFGNGDEKVFYPLDEWAAELYAKNAARLALEQQGLKVVQVYPNNRFIWAKDRDGNPTWVLVSFHHAAIKGVPDYSGFDKNHPNVAGKAGYGVDVALSNGGDDSLTGSGAFKPVYRSWNVVSEVVSMTKIAEREVVAAQEKPSPDMSRLTPEDARGKEEDEEDLYDEYGLRKRKPIQKKDEDEKPVEMMYGKQVINNSDATSAQDKKDENKAAIKAKIAKMSVKEMMEKSIPILKKKLASDPTNEKWRKMLAHAETYLSKTKSYEGLGVVPK